MAEEMESTYVPLGLPLGQDAFEDSAKVPVTSSHSCSREKFVRGKGNTRGKKKQKELECTKIKRNLTWSALIVGLEVRKRRVVLEKLKKQKMRLARTNLKGDDKGADAAEDSGSYESRFWNYKDSDLSDSDADLSDTDLSDADRRDRCANIIKTISDRQCTKYDFSSEALQHAPIPPPSFGGFMFGLVLDEESADDDLRRLANTVLEEYNMREGFYYEYVSMITLFPIRSPEDPYLFGEHMNFLARCKGTDTSPELFFGSTGYRSSEVHGCKLDPDSTGECLGHGILHCEHVNCSECAKWILRDGSFDSSAETRSGVNTGEILGEQASKLTKDAKRLADQERSYAYAEI